jgi:O-antigen/teichoic acid export membrane protein
MQQSKRIAINTLTSWLGMFANAAVLIFLARFLLHRLGTDQFGMLQYVLTIQGSLLFLDLGLGTTLNRFVSRLLAVDDVARLNGAVSFVSLLFFGLGIIAGLAMTAIGFVLPDLLTKCSAELYSSGLMLMVCIGGALTIRFWGYAPQGLLFGAERYDVVNVIRASAAVLRAASITVLFFTLDSAGLVTVGLCFVGTAILETTSMWMFVKKHFPELRLRLRNIEKGVVREVCGFSFYVMTLGITTMLIVNTPTFFAGRLYGAESVAFISLSVLVLSQIRRVAAGFAPVLIPVAGKYGALDDKKILQKILIRGTKFCATMCFPVGVIAVIFSKPLFEWFKEGFGWTWALLAIMMLPILVRSTQRVSSSVLFGAGSVRGIAIGQIVLVLAIVVLSWLFAVYFDMKLYGIALGSAIPTLLYSVSVPPIYACRRTGFKWLTYMVQSYGGVILGLIPASVVAVGLVQFSCPSNLIMIVVEGMICLLISILTAWWFVLTTDERESILNLFKNKRASYGQLGTEGL